VTIGLTTNLAVRYCTVRAQTEALARPLTAEDSVVQSMPDASPTKWHLAHTTWFFETFVLGPAHEEYRPFDSRFSYLFNSYYNAVGARLARSDRGLLSRPSLEEVFRYRAHVDQRMAELFESAAARRLGSTIVLGLNHEQQHQELILTDIKHAFGVNPLRPPYREVPRVQDRREGAVAPLDWRAFPAGLRRIGWAGHGFAFDNEGPCHRAFVEGFRIATRLVTAGEYLKFLGDGGYERPELWLSDGWNARRQHDWNAPLYWERDGGRWQLFTLGGLLPIDPAEPVCHVSYYEADAFARWAGARLATEAEWEVAAGPSIAGNFLEDEQLHPRALPAGEAGQFFGDAWEWTCSPYGPYPGYRPVSGALGEYNGKFMCNQMVLRGGSCATPRAHIRSTYRNFFPPEARWQFSAIRLAGND
jgi:ergothioneine biosynthesis protein EgtB